MQYDPDYGPYTADPRDPRYPEPMEWEEEMECKSCGRVVLCVEAFDDEFCSAGCAEEGKEANQ